MIPYHPLMLMIVKGWTHCDLIWGRLETPQSTSLKLIRLVRVDLELFIRYVVLLRMCAYLALTKN